MIGARTKQRIENHKYGIKSARAKKQFRCEMEIVKDDYLKKKKKLTKKSKSCSDEKLKKLQDDYMEKTEKIQKILADKMDDITLEWHENSLAIENGGVEF